MKLAIHQPEFMPWLGFFYKMALADLYVVFDRVQFKKRYFENRNKIVSPKEEVSWVYVPVITKGRYTQLICDVEIDNTQQWKNKLLKKIQHFYGHSPYYRQYYNEFSSLVHAKNYSKLLEFNMELINFFRKYLGISTPMLYSSNLGVDSYKGSDLILQICILKNADVYLYGASGKDYLREEDFRLNGIDIEWLDYKHPNYKQLCTDFIPNMSILDLMFNHGEKSLEILMGKSK